MIGLVLCYLLFAGDMYMCYANGSTAPAWVQRNLCLATTWDDDIVDYNDEYMVDVELGLYNPVTVQSYVKN